MSEANVGMMERGAPEYLGEGEAGFEEALSLSCAPKQAPPPAPVSASGTPVRSGYMHHAHDLAAAAALLPEPLDLPQPPGMSLAYPQEILPVSPEPLSEVHAPVVAAPVPVAVAVPHPQPVYEQPMNVKTPQSSAKRRTKSHQYFSNLSAGLSADGMMGTPKRDREALKRARGTKKVATMPLEATNITMAHHMQNQDQMIHELGRELSTSNERYNEAKRQLESTLESSQGNNVNLISRLKDANARIDTLEKLREEDRLKWLATVESWKSHLDETDSKSRKDRETLELRLSAYEQSIQFSDDLSALLQKSEQRLLESNRDLDTQKAQYRELAKQNEDVEAEASAAKRDLQAAMAEQSHVAEQATFLQTMVTSLRSELSKSSVEKEGLESRLEGMHANAEKLSISLAATSREVEQQKENHAILLENCQAEHRSEMASRQNDNELELNKLRREISVRTQQYEDEIGGLRHDLVSQSHTHENEVNTLQREFDTSLTRLRTQHQQEKRLDTEMLEALKQEIKELEVRSQETLQALDNTQTHADEKLFSKTKEVHDMKAEVAGLQQNVKAVESENQVFVRNQAFLETQLEDLQTKQREDLSKILHHERMLVTAQERDSATKGHLAESEAKNAVLQERLTTVLTENEQLSTQLTQAYRKVDHVKNNVSIGERQAKRQHSDAERLREECIMKDTLIEELRGKVVVQQMDVQQLRLKLVEASLNKRSASTASAQHHHFPPASIPRAPSYAQTPSVRCASLTSPDPSSIHPAPETEMSPAEHMLTPEKSLPRDPHSPLFESCE